MEALAEHIGLNPIFDGNFLGMKHVMLMRWRFRGRGTTLRAYPSRARRKEDSRINRALDRSHCGCLWGEGMEHGLHPPQGLAWNEVDLVQEQEICCRDLILKSAFQVSPFHDLLGIHHDNGHVIIYPGADRLTPEVELCIKGQGDAWGLDNDPVGTHALPEHL